MDETQLSMESAKPPVSGCESILKPESMKQPNLFLTLLMMRVLDKCNAFKSCNLDDWVAY